MSPKAPLYLNLRKDWSCKLVVVCFPIFSNRLLSLLREEIEAHLGFHLSDDRAKERKKERDVGRAMQIWLSAISSSNQPPTWCWQTILHTTVTLHRESSPTKIEEKTEISCKERNSKYEKDEHWAGLQKRSKRIEKWRKTFLKFFLAGLRCSRD